MTDEEKLAYLEGVEESQWELLDEGDFSKKHMNQILEAIERSQRIRANLQSNQHFEQPVIDIKNSLDLTKLADDYSH